MKNLTLLFFLCFSVAATAQPISPESIENDFIGWKKVFHFKGTKEPKKNGNHLFSANQMSLCDTLANWMQASYVPKGGLGEIKKAISGYLGANNQYEAGIPQNYGAYSKTYIELRYNNSHVIEPVTNSNVWWGVYANGMPGGWPAVDLCTPTTYYFTLPGADADLDENTKKQLDISAHPNIKPYISFWTRNEGYGRGREAVLLCKDNKSPFVKITRGEYLQALEAGISQYYEKEKKRIREANPGNENAIAYEMKGQTERRDQRIAAVKKTREIYKGQLDEPATITESQASVSVESYADVFNGTGGSKEKYVIYKVDPAIAELCKTDKPQWIMVRWDYWPGDRMEQQQHEAILNNFNFEYVYNFFFAPEKVKGQPYKPLRSPIYKEAVTITDVSANSKKNAADKTVHFYDDFSANVVGKVAVGWRTETVSAGGKVAAVDGADGKWLMVAGDYIKSTTLKPLPQNFTFSYDLIALQNFTWGTHGLTVQLAKGTASNNLEYSTALKLRPGFDGRPGEVTLESGKTHSYDHPASKYAQAPGFSNNKKVNRVSVTLKKIGEKLEVYIDDTKVIDLEKAIPATQLLNFMMIDGGSENDKFYISNIKITKD